MGESNILGKRSEGKLSKKEKKIKDESIKAINLIKKTLRNKQAVMHKEPTNPLQNKRSKLAWKRESLNRFLKSRSIFDN
jgi:hypothetical protein